ncbi:sucrase ferredoxin [Yinghuangia seranimata]|uniref:sucrase ferredoxin n=1 Tax=Yinghuangia seranimata TaxID=408067 RepID=UPI00248C022C|nr:sucrase ferredoxin [Yinghuangia seranimata]MDI2128684.1 sucrase ferredoxin [Yinghuangia seranimata]
METCTELSWRYAEPMAGSAPTSPGWLLVEHPGPWAAKALTGTRGIDPELGGALERQAAAAGFRATLIRRPGRTTETVARRTAFLVWTEPGATWARRLTVDSLGELLALDFAALAGPAEPALGTAWTEPLALVCTNGKRDRCCATEGRPLAEALAGRAPDAVWEATHLGGHRFAPTAVVLPHGYVYGRLDADSALAALDAARGGAMVVDGCRGRSTWSRPEQAAEIAVREDTGETSADALRVDATEEHGEHAWTVRIAHTDGRTWTVEVTAAAEEPARPESCGKGLGNPLSMRPRLVTPTPAL